MRMMCCLIAATIGLDEPVGNPPADFVVPSSLYAFQLPPGGFGGGGGPGATSGMTGMGTMNDMGSNMGGMGMGGGGMGMSGMGTSGMGMSGMGTSGMGMSGMGTSGMGMSGMGMSGMGMSNSWGNSNQVGQNTAATTTSTRPAEILSESDQDELELTAKQRKRVRTLQQKVDAALKEILDEDQQDYLETMAARRANRATNLR